MSYVFTVTVDNTTEQEGDAPVQGFQLSVQDAAGNHIGELLLNDAVNTRYAGNIADYVTHTAVGRFETSWTMEWISPQQGDAPEVVTVYVAGNATNGNGNVSGDYVYTTTATIPLKATSSEPQVVAGAFVLNAIYPNPARLGTTVELELERTLTVTLRVFDGLGRVVRTADSGQLPAGTHDLRLNVEDFATGLYFVEVSTPEGSLVRPISVLR